MVTWPRSRNVVQGQLKDGKKLNGEYHTSVMTAREVPRKFYHIAFVESTDLNTAAKKKQLVALIDDIPQSAVKKESDFVVSEKYTGSILFNDAAVDDWLESLADSDHVTSFYVITEKKSDFDKIRAQVEDLLGPTTEMAERKKPMSEGFCENIEYFRLDFLDKNRVALGRQFREILPILWMRSGSIGRRPALPKNKPLPDFLLPSENRFAVLINDTKFRSFAREVSERDDLSHVFLVTDSEEAFQEMSSQIDVPVIVQIYRDYLENFVINKGGEL